MSTVTVVYTTDSDGRFIHTELRGWRNVKNIIVSDHPFHERGFYSLNKIKANSKGVGNYTLELKPIVFVESLMGAISEALKRSEGRDIYVLGSHDITNEALKYADYITHITYKGEQELVGEGMVAIREDEWRRFELVNKGHERVTKYVRRNFE